MSQSKRRSRKSKLVPRKTDGGVPEIEKVIESEDDNEEPPIKILNTMSLAPQPGPSKADDSIQFKVDIEVEEWVDDELFIEENFNKMQTEILSKALDKEIIEEADWTNEEFGKMWAKTASDSEQEEKPVNEYEKIIKNQVNPSLLKKLSDKQESSKDTPELVKDRPVLVKDMPRSVKDRPESSKGSEKSKDKPNYDFLEDNLNYLPLVKRGRPKNSPVKLPSQLISASRSLLKPIRHYKRPGSKSKTVLNSNSLEEPTTRSSIYTKISLDQLVKKTDDDESSERKLKMWSVDNNDPSIIDLPPATLEDKNNTLLTREHTMDNPTAHKRMTISELDEFVKIHIPSPEPYDNKMVSLKEIYVSEDEILAKSQMISSNTNNPIDYILNIEVKNRMGYTRFVPIKMSREDALIDFGLRDWYKWANKNNVTALPLTYKCYICDEGWWHLHQFRVHLKKHVTVNITYETHFQESSIIVHNGRRNYRVIPISGNCWQCGKDYLHHCKLVYNCRACDTILYSCKALAEHEGICLYIWKEQMKLQKTKDVKAYKCKICPQIFFSEKLLHDHQHVSHVPRSDKPILVQSNVKSCVDCDQSYSDNSFHYCNKRVLNLQCKNCSRYFPSIKALTTHLSTRENKVRCTICDKMISKECMMPNHLLGHNRNYMLVYKCMICTEKNVLLENATMATRHCEFVHHAKKCVRSMWCFVQVVIPISLISKTVFTRHPPTFVHDKLKSLFLKDMPLDYRYKPIQDPVNYLDEIDPCDDSEGNYDLDYLEGTDFQGNSEVTDVQENLEAGASEEVAQDTLEDHDAAEETPTIKIENVMENHFEVNPSNLDGKKEFKPKIIDTTSIKVEKEENIEGTEVDPSDLMDKKHSGFLSVVKTEPNDEFDTSDMPDQYIETNISDASTSNAGKDFSIQLLEHLSTRDDDDEIAIDDNIHYCLNCDFEGIKKKFKEHLKTCDGEIAVRKQELTCTKCNREFTSLRDYVQHLPKHGFIRCKCLDCNRDFQNISTWVLHIKIHIRRTFTLVKLMSKNCNLYRCRFCKEFVEKKMFFKHWEMHFEPPKKKKLPLAAEGVEGNGGMSPQLLSRIQEIFAMEKSHEIPRNCIVCNRFFGRLNEKKRHLVEHLLEAAVDEIVANNGLVCQFCGAKVLKNNDFRRHMRDHAAITMYHCEFCNKSFSDSSNFVKHKKVHDVDYMYVCDVCNKKFLAKSSLRAHIDTHRPDPLRCPRCPDKLFYSESAYKRHVKVYHDRLSYYRCQYCRQRFHTVRHMWDHLWEEHQVRTQKADCPMCGKQFRKVQDVKSHLHNDHVKKLE